MTPDIAWTPPSAMAERVVAAWNAEHSRWCVRENGRHWIVCRQDGEAFDIIASVGSMLGADKRMFALRDEACGMAALSASGLGDAVAIMRDVVAPYRGKPDDELPDGHIIARARAWLKQMEE
jgi:hypothetical protein